MNATRDSWLAAHSYLQPLARWTTLVEDAAAGMDAATAAIPDWTSYADEFRDGLPMLPSAEAGIDLEPAGRMTVALVETLSVSAPPEGPSADLAALARELRQDTEAPRRIAAWLLGGDGPATSSPGLLRYLAWSATRPFLAPAARSFAAWRDEEREQAWLRRYCPTCGSGPAMAQLVGRDPGRRRTLVCGSCQTRWQFRRTQCPFCENDAQSLTALTVEGESGLRIDHCESCHGYLKTYDGEGNEDVLLADWTSLHLDLLAQDRGLVKCAPSLFALDFRASARPVDSGASNPVG
jgi:FdhE protein